MSHWRGHRVRPQVEVFHSGSFMLLADLVGQNLPLAHHLRFLADRRNPTDCIRS